MDIEGRELSIRIREGSTVSKVAASSGRLKASCLKRSQSNYDGFSNSSIEPLRIIFNCERMFELKSSPEGEVFLPFPEWDNNQVSQMEQ